MNKKAVQRKIAANKDPSLLENSESCCKEVVRSDPELSEGSGIVAQFLKFIENMCPNEKVKQVVALLMVVTLLVIVLTFAVAAVIVVARGTSPFFLGGASVISAGTTWLVGRRRDRRSPPSEEEPRD
jgi:hypothetical protein